MSPARHPRTAAVIGGGPAGLMAAETLARAGVSVMLYERMARVGRKLLLAGRGGLNLTHSEPLDVFLKRYREAEPRLAPAIAAFPPAALRDWCEALGQETFVGTSGRVFPRAMKTSPLLRAWLQRLRGQGVEIRLRHRWTGWDAAGRLLFETPEGRSAVEADCTVLALGGASWPHLGADGSWQPVLAERGVAIAPLSAANCGARVAWSDAVRTRCAGQPLKRIALTLGAETVRGEAVISADGLEGGAVYALSAPLRREIAARGVARLLIDLRPDETVEALSVRLTRPRAKQSLATFLRKTVSLDAPAVGLLHEAALAAGTPLASLCGEAMARLIKSVPVVVTAQAGIARAISTAGGVAFAGIDDAFMLRARPGTFVAGEMIDWEAPTGGYLLQACFATGQAAAKGALAYLAR